eukprot:17836-Rhodomonas_salina.2
MSADSMLAVLICAELTSARSVLAMSSMIRSLRAPAVRLVSTWHDVADSAQARGTAQAQAQAHLVSSSWDDAVPTIMSAFATSDSTQHPLPVSPRAHPHQSQGRGCSPLRSVLAVMPSQK